VSREGDGERAKGEEVRDIVGKGVKNNEDKEGLDKHTCIACSVISGSKKNKYEMFKRVLKAVKAE